MSNFDINTINFTIYKQSDNVVTINNNEIRRAIIKYTNMKNVDVYVTGDLYKNLYTNKLYVHNIMMKSIIKPSEEMLKWVNS